MFSVCIMGLTVPVQTTSVLGSDHSDTFSAKEDVLTSSEVPWFDQFYLVMSLFKFSPLCLKLLKKRKKEPINGKKTQSCCAEINFTVKAKSSFLIFEQKLTELSHHKGFSVVENFKDFFITCSSWIKSWASKCILDAGQLLDFSLNFLQLWWTKVYCHSQKLIWAALYIYVVLASDH